MKSYFLVLGLIFVCSCKRAEPAGLNFYFENPQPINDSELSRIPNKFQGIYMNSDSVFINIKEKVILTENYNKFRFNKNNLDSIRQGFDIVGNKYISKFDKDVFEYKYLGDSIEFSSKRIDTFFIFSNSQKAKRINGQLVLNTKDSIFWKIKLINLEKNSLKIKYIYSNDDLKRMDSVTKVKSVMIDSSSFIIKPSRREFINILKLKHLGGDIEYKKVSKSEIKNHKSAVNIILDNFDISFFQILSNYTTLAHPRSMRKALTELNAVKFDKTQNVRSNPI